MAIRAILVTVDGSETPETVLETAFTLGRDLQAHLQVLHIPLHPLEEMPFFGEGIPEAQMNAFRIEIGKIEDRNHDLHQHFDALCTRFEVPAIGAEPPVDKASATWIEERGHREEIVARRGRLADLIMVPRPVDDVRKIASEIFHAALRETGRPVLVAPPATSLAFGRVIAVAWNGSAEAARAVGAALPFLEAAERVVILTAESERTLAATAGEVADYLACHGVSAETQVFAKSFNPPVGKALLENCRDFGADLLVMGAYTHSRWREMLLGGVTQYVLTHAEIPVLMAH